MIAFDWSHTPLGPVEHWSEPLRAAVTDALRDRRVATTPSPAAALDALFSAAPLGLAIWDRDLRFVRVNASLAEMNGLSPEAHIGRTPKELLPGIEGLDALMARWREILATGEAWHDVEVFGQTPAAPSRARSWTEHFFPIRSGAEIVGIGAVVEETTERRRMEAALRASEARLRDFAEASSDILWLRNVETREFEFLGAPLRKLFGEDAGGGDVSDPARIEAIIEAIVAEDRAAAADAIREVRQGHQRTHSFRVRLPGRTGTRWFRNTAFPLRDADGVVRRIGGITQDVTEERETAQRLQMLIGELQHRTRNLMGVVQAIAESTLASSTGLEAFAASFSARIAALSRVQNLLSRLEGLERIGFDELLRSELSAFGALPEEDGRVSLDGPPAVALRSSGIQTLALALHELITNATKYGALSQPGARLAIAWQLLRPAGDTRAWLRISWTERGVRIPDHAGRSGQGRELIEEAVPYQLGARVQFGFAADGLRCVIELPLSRAATAPDAPA
ncbi:sensor histidine kinase [Sphingomonas morindae]|uniref:histidine kinase n=1 Tax=Sphingomonas morindae TaxID=1541170 RepID=A0ABY4XD46_9SPHN|nr:PAS domain-containing protein [Sphingomonas morindae]USI74764.1 PAS domain-containing protein [Sphingomonas morindae]